MRKLIRAYPLLPIGLAVAATLPGLIARFSGAALDPPLMAILAGGAIMGASFLLLWACDAAQTDMPQTLALAVVAFIAVLPEYAVDMYFTWQAGQHPAGGYAEYAVANMTGANRLLIGVAWVVVVAAYWYKARRPVQLDDERRTELFFLAAATLYAVLIPIKGTLAWYDGLVFIGIYVVYVVIVSRRPITECDVAGTAACIVCMPTAKRRTATALMFLFSALVILLNAEPFSENLVSTGTMLGINEFFLVQWLAPIASETPEFLVATMFALRGQAGMALGSLLASKLNQWTLLVGMIPWVYAGSSTQLSHPIPMGAVQMDEILLTAAQSALAVVLLASLRLTFSEALLLFVLFAGQLVSPVVVEYLGGSFLGVSADHMHMLFSLLYFTIAGALIMVDPGRLRPLWKAWTVKGVAPAEDLCD